MHYNAVPHATRQDYGVSKIMKDVDVTATNPVPAVEEDAVHRTTGIGAEAVVLEPTVILHITVGHM